MKKLLLSFLALSLMATGSALATQVEVTMNAKSKLIKSLKGLNNDAIVEVGEPTSNKYTFDAPDGSYLLTATAADGETVSGTIQLDIDADHATFAIFSPEVRVKNADWVYGTDYTLTLKVTDKEGGIVNTTMGEYTSGNKMFLVFSGNTYYLDLVPSEAHLAEGYLPVTYSGTVTANPTIQAEAPMSDLFTISVPATAELFVGTKTAHFVKFKEVAPQNVATEGNTKTYTYRLADKQQYNYRVTQPSKVTQAGLFTMSIDQEKRPVLDFTDTDLSGLTPRIIDHAAESNDGYNVADIFLNINPSGHLKLANVGDTYDILPMRNWELVNSITANYFIEPDFHFRVLNTNGEADNSVVKVEDELLTAVGKGTAIVLVYYDAIHLDLYDGAEKKSFVGGSDWSAIWPENTGVFVVTVGEEATGITPNITINKDYLTTVTPWGGGDPIDTKLSMENVDAEFDVLYFLTPEDFSEGGYDYTFTPEGVATVTLARPMVSMSSVGYTGFSEEGVTKNADGSYTLHLTEGRNIVCLTNAAGQSVYQVMTAKPCSRTITVNGEVVTKVKPGDEVTIQYSGLYHPAGKLAGIHNFFGFLDYKQATEGITVNKSKANQYKMASTPEAQAVTFTVPEDWTQPTIELTDGVLGISGYGDPVGNHRATSKLTGRAPNFTAISQSAVLGRVPAVVLTVDVPSLAEETTISTMEDTGMEFNDKGFWNGGMIGEGEEGDWGEVTYHCPWISGLLTGYVDYSFMDMDEYSYDWWGGIALSKRTGTTLESLDDQYNNIVGTGANGSETFAVVYGEGIIDVNVEGGATVNSMYVVNSAYAMQNILVGDGYSKKFEEEGDHLYMNIVATKADGTEKTEVVKLAEFTTELNYIKDWTKIDLSGFGSDVTKLTFQLTAHNSGVPLYACIDDIEVSVPVTEAEALEVADFENLELDDESYWNGTDDTGSFVSGSFKFENGHETYDYGTYLYDYCYGFFYTNMTSTNYEGDASTEQYKSCVGSGVDGSRNFATYNVNSYNPKYVEVLTDEGAVIPGFYITNSAYAYTSMVNGDDYAKKFDLGDWFMLTVTGYDADGEVTGTKDFYLADLRDADNAYIINDWRYVDLSGLGKVKKLGFDMSSSDTGDWGMNTPAYFCMDNLGAKGVEELPESNVTVGIQYVATESQQTENVYDLQGRRITPSTKGIYVKNGKKVVVR